MSDDIFVLYVDGNAALRDLTAELLEDVNSNITVGTEADPTTVPYRLAVEDVDCIVSEYELPTMDGLELCKRIRRDHPELPFFIFTNNDDRAVIEEALELGATDYIEKYTGIEHYKLLANRISNAVEEGESSGKRYRMFVPDRDRGIFTADDRMFLLGEKEFSQPTSETNTRRRIRNRIQNSLLDLSYLPLLESDDVRQVFEEIPQPHVHHGLSGLMAFVYVALGGDVDPLEELIESGIFTAGSLSDDGPILTDVDVTIDISREPNINRILEKHEDGPQSNLTNSELGLLFRSGKVDAADLEQYVVD